MQFRVVAISAVYPLHPYPHPLFQLHLYTGSRSTGISYKVSIDNRDWLTGSHSVDIWEIFGEFTCIRVGALALNGKQIH